MFRSRGTLRYYESWAVVYIDPEIAKYYRSQLPQSLEFNVPKYPPHITVVRKDREIVLDQSLWNAYGGEVVEFTYEHTVCSDDKYFWLKAYSKRIEEIRIELGLPRIRNGFTEFHVTIANTKGLLRTSDQEP